MLSELEVPENSSRQQLRQRLAVLEQERVPGYHTTGRSAAISSLNFISPTVQALTLASRDFLTNHPECFGAHPLTSLRQSLWVTQPHQIEAHNAKLTSDPVTACRITADVFPFAVVTVTEPAMDGFPTTWQNQ